MATTSPTPAAALKLPSPRKPRTQTNAITPLEPGPLPTPDRSSIRFSLPVRRILTPEDLSLFHSSPTYSLLYNFILSLNHAILDKPLSHNLQPDSDRPVIVKILKLLDRIEEITKANPPVDNGGSRFGNEGFRHFYDALTDKAEDLHAEMDLGLDDGAVMEMSRYLRESFGNRTRIDYGSGHELNFICWLLCLQQLSYLPTKETHASLAILVFPKYLHLMRSIQQAYYLEPAGSHGVWGLDDYQFLPFMFGSAQLFHHRHLRPMSIHNEEVLEQFGDDYMYLDCIRFINSIKTTAALRWHSPMLDDISSAKNWGKVNVGMCKMWEKEVLGKLPIMQHFLFGGLLPATHEMGRAEIEEREMTEKLGGMEIDGGDGDLVGSENMRFEGKSAEEIEAIRGELDREGMRHVHSTWGECCGIKVPSAVAAREVGDRGALRSVNRIPFD